MVEFFHTLSWQFSMELQNFRIVVTSINYLFTLFKALQLDYLFSCMVVEACPHFLVMVVMQSSLFH
jgi:hypothetical protein